MLLYNVTTKVDWTIADDWVKWMLDFHIPEVLGTGCFEKHQFVKLLDIDETEGPTYAVQYFAATQQDYDNYIQLYANRFRSEVIVKWGQNFIAFRTLMQVIN